MSVSLYCISYAGGSVQIFNELEKYISNNVKLKLLEMPGKGIRMREPLPECYQDALDDVVQRILEDSENDEVAIMGYSMGCFLAFDVTKILEKKYNISVVKLFVAANSAPSQKVVDEFCFWNYKGEEFLDKIAQYGEIPDVLRNNSKIMKFYARSLENDFRLLGERRKNLDFEKVNAPIVAIGGSEDSMSKDVSQWVRHTNTTFEMYVMNGGHFFIKNNYERVANLLNEKLK